VSGRSIWGVLGIAATSDTTEIRRAYARRLKVTHPEDDAAGFQALRQAYDIALRQARYAQFAAEQEALEAADEEPEEAPEAVAGEAGPEPVQAVVEEPETVPEAPSPIAVRLTGLQPEIPIAPVAAREPLPPPAPVVAPPALPPVLTEEDLLAQALELEAENLRVEAFELDRLLKAKPFDVAPAVAQMKRLTASPALDNLALMTGFESWLENILLSNLPAADVLLPQAMARFGWTPHRDFSAQRRVGDGVLARDDDLKKLRELASPSNRYHAAYKALTRQPTRWRIVNWLLTPGLREDVAKVMEAVLDERPGLWQNFDAGALDWWRTAGDRPSLPPAMIWMLGGLPLGIALVWTTQQTTGTLDLRGLLGSLVVSAALGAGYFYGLVRPRFYWRRRPDPGPVWAAWGWAPAALALPVLAAGGVSLGLQGPWAIGGVGLAGFAVVVWAAITGQPDPGHNRQSRVSSLMDGMNRPGRWPVKYLARYAYVILFWLFLLTVLPASAWMVLSVAVLVAAIALAMGMGGLKARFMQIAPAKRLGLYGPLTGGLVVLAGLVAVFGTWDGLRPWLAVAAALPALIDPVADDILDDEKLMQRAGFLALLCGAYWMLLRIVGMYVDGPLRINGVWLLSGVAFSLWLAYRRDHRTANPPRRPVTF
jgi:hypothetical protein